MTRGQCSCPRQEQQQQVGLTRGLSAMIFMLWLVFAVTPDSIVIGIGRFFLCDKLSAANVAKDGEWGIDRLV